MQAIRLILSILFLFLITNAFGQDEIYAGKKKKNAKKELVKVNVADRNEQVSFDQYTTERDYNEKNHVNEGRIQGDDDYWEEEIYHDDDQRKRDRNNDGGELAAQIIFDVVVNTVFIIATFWH